MGAAQDVVAQSVRIDEAVGTPPSDSLDGSFDHPSVHTLALPASCTPAPSEPAPIDAPRDPDAPRDSGYSASDAIYAPANSASTAASFAQSADPSADLVGASYAAISSAPDNTNDFRSTNSSTAPVVLTSPVNPFPDWAGSTGSATPRTAPLVKHHRKPSPLTDFRTLILTWSSRQSAYPRWRVLK